jgi:hypothetical protein
LDKRLFIEGAHDAVNPPVAKRDIKGISIGERLLARALFEHS